MTRTYSLPVLFAGGHPEATEKIGRISQLVEGRGVKVVLDCPERERVLAAPICTVMVKGATRARARWAFFRVVRPLLLAASR